MARVLFYAVLLQFISLTTWKLSFANWSFISCARLGWKWEWYYRLRFSYTKGLFAILLAVELDCFQYNRFSQSHGWIWLYIVIRLIWAILRWFLWPKIRHLTFRPYFGKIDTCSILWQIRLSLFLAFMLAVFLMLFFFFPSNFFSKVEHLLTSQYASGHNSIISLMHLRSQFIFTQSQRLFPICH